MRVVHRTAAGRSPPVTDHAAVTRSLREHASPDSQLVFVGQLRVRDDLVRRQAGANAVEQSEGVTG